MPRENLLHAGPSIQTLREGNKKSGCELREKIARGLLGRSWSRPIAIRDDLLRDGDALRS